MYFLFVQCSHFRRQDTSIRYWHIVQLCLHNCIFGRLQAFQQCVYNLECLSAKLQNNAGSIPHVKLFRQQLRPRHSAPFSPRMPNISCTTHSIIQGCGTRQIRVHTPAIRGKVFRDPRIDSALFRIQHKSPNWLYGRKALSGIPPAVQRICKHDTHMAEHRAVFLVPVGQRPAFCQFGNLLDLAAYSV